MFPILDQQGKQRMPINDVLTKTQQGKYKEDFSLIPNYAAYK